MGTLKEDLTFWASSWWFSTSGITLLPPPGWHVHTLTMPLNPLAVVLQGRFRLRSCWESLPLLIPARVGALPRSVQDWGQERVGPRVPSAGLLLLDISLVQVATYPTEVFPPVLCSSKVTCLLSLAGLGEGAHLFVESPVQPTTKGTCPCWPASRHLLWLLIHLLLCECQWLSSCPWLLDHPWETEQLSLLMWPFSMAAATSAW